MLHLPRLKMCEQNAGAVERGGLQCFEVGARVEELLHPDFSQWPRRAKRGEPERTTRVYRPIPLQSLGNSKVSLEHAFKSLMNQICDSGAGEYVFLRCAAVQRGTACRAPDERLASWCYYMS